jgi:hypothetical protein
MMKQISKIMPKFSADNWAYILELLKLKAYIFQVQVTGAPNSNALVMRPLL